MPEPNSIDGDTKPHPVTFSVSHDTPYKKCPTCGFATIYKNNPAQDAFEEVLMKCRGYLAHHPTDKKARLLIQEIDVFLLAR